MGIFVTFVNKRRMSLQAGANERGNPVKLYHNTNLSSPD
jgi:hypothetical protein